MGDSARWRRYPRRLVFILAGLGTAAPLVCWLTYALAPGIPYYSLLPALLPLMLLLPLLNFRRRVYGILIELAAALAVGFGAFFSAPLGFRAAAAVFAFTAAAALAQVNAENLTAVGFFCGIMIFFDIAVGLVSLTPALAGIAYVFGFSVPLSILSMATFLILNSLDGARSFGADRIRIPRATKRLTVALIAALAALTALGSLSSLLARGAIAVWNGLMLVVGAAGRLFLSLLAANPASSNSSSGAASSSAVSSAPVKADPVWLNFLFIAVGLLITAAFVVFLLYKAGKLLGRLLRYFASLIRRQEDRDGAVFTEEVEKIEPERRRRAGAAPENRPRYSSLRSERERVRYVYREYVRRARRARLTEDPAGGTPTEILGGIRGRTDEKFPAPEGLDVAYNAARYGNSEMPPGGADEMKKRLL